MIAEYIRLLALSKQWGNVVCVRKHLGVEERNENQLFLRAISDLSGD